MDDLWAVAQARSRGAPDDLAVWTPRDALSFRQLSTRADALTSALRRSGIEAERIVALALPNGADFVACVLALRRLGSTVALVSPLYQAAELRAIAEAVRPQALLTTTSLASRLAAGLAATRIDELDAGAGAAALALVVPDAAAAPAPGDAALLKFSSGSTGVPKGIELTDANLAAEARTIVATMELTPDDRILATVVLCHSYGFDLGVLAMLHSGAALVLPDFFVPQRIVADLRTHDVSVFLGVPDMYRRWLEHADGGPPSLPRLRHLLSCTAPLDAGLIRDFHARTGLPICQHYGSSETGAVTLHLPAEILARPHSVGRPMHGVDVRIVADGGMPAACGEEGEVVVSSHAVARRYVMGGPAADVLSSGTFRTGDLGSVDEAGFLHVHGRLDAIVNIDGRKVSPAEVRAALERFPAVREAAVIGAASPDGRPRLLAAVTLRDAATAAEIVAFCYTQLAAYKVPERLEIRDELPRGPTGKVRLRAEDFAGE